MKKYITISILIFSVNMLFGQAIMKFDTTLIDCGLIVKENGGVLRKEIKFTNTGKELLVVYNALTGDGGSFAAYPKEPIFPGKTGIITFVYDISRIGKFSRCIQISTTAGTIVLVAKGEVVPEEKK